MMVPGRWLDSSGHLLVLQPDVSLHDFVIIFTVTVTIIIHQLVLVLNPPTIFMVLAGLMIISFEPMINYQKSVTRDTLHFGTKQSKICREETLITEVKNVKWQSRELLPRTHEHVNKLSNQLKTLD